MTFDSGFPDSPINPDDDRARRRLQAIGRAMRRLNEEAEASDDGLYRLVDGRIVAFVDDGHKVEMDILTRSDDDVFESLTKYAFSDGVLRVVEIIDVPAGAAESIMRAKIAGGSLLAVSDTVQASKLYVLLSTFETRIFVTERTLTRINQIVEEYTDGSPNEVVEDQPDDIFEILEKRQRTFSAGELNVNLQYQRVLNRETTEEFDDFSVFVNHPDADGVAITETYSYNTYDEQAEYIIVSVPMEGEDWRGGAAEVDEDQAFDFTEERGRALLEQVLVKINYAEAQTPRAAKKLNYDDFVPPVGERAPRRETYEALITTALAAMRLTATVEKKVEQMFQYQDAEGRPASLRIVYFPPSFGDGKGWHKQTLEVERTVLGGKVRHHSVTRAYATGEVEMFHFVDEENPFEGEGQKALKRSRLEEIFEMYRAMNASALNDSQVAEITKQIASFNKPTK